MQPSFLQPCLFDVDPAVPSGSEYSRVFDAWLEARLASGQIRSTSTSVLYREMWGSFTHWCEAHSPPLRLACICSADLQRFQTSRSGAKNDEISARHALRLLRLIDQVLKHFAFVVDHNSLAHTATSTASATSTTAATAAQQAIDAQPEVRYADSSSQDRLPLALDDAAAKQLIVFLSAAWPRPGAGAVDMSWQDLRNRVAAALQLGAGLGPIEVRTLTLRSIVMSAGRAKDRPLKLLVPATGESAAHETPMAPWAAELLQHWLSVRSGKAIFGNWLFPSTLSGKPWGKVAQYNAARQVMQDAGLDLPGGGSFVLRHTFAIRQLRRGTDPDQVAQWMGVSEPKVMSRYLKLLESSAEVV